jgi:membrane glycosyltransferase
LRAHWGHTLIGFAWAWILWRMDHPAFWWFAPVMAGMVTSIPLSVWTSRARLGARARSFGLFLTPEEVSPPSELDTLRVRMALLEKQETVHPHETDASVAEAVLDPYINAIHVSLLREKRLNPEYREMLEKLGAGQPQARVLGERLLSSGPDTLNDREKLTVFSDADVMSWLHRQAWIRSAESLAPWWQESVRRFSR